MDIRPIRDESVYKAALKEISTLLDQDPEIGKPEANHLDTMVTLVLAYESKHYQIEPPNSTEPEPEP